MDISSLPTGVFCVTVESIIDDANTVERYLAEYPVETERCIPLALRNMLSPAGEALGFSPMRIPSADNTMHTLHLMWNVEKRDWSKVLADAAYYGLLYLLPYIFAQDTSIRVWGNTLRGAVFSNNIDVVKMLILLSDDKEMRDDIVLQAVFSACPTAAFMEELLSPLILPSVMPRMCRLQDRLFPGRGLPPSTLKMRTLPAISTKLAESVLSLASENCNTDVLRTILSHIDAERRIDALNFRNPDPGKTPLESAVSGSKIDNMKYLIEQKANVVGVDQTMLFESIRHDSVDILNLLVNEGAVPSEIALVSAAEIGNTNVVERLLELKVNPVDEALFVASNGGSSEIVRYLIDAHADVHADNDHALELAVSAEHLDTVSTLLELKANAHTVVPDDISSDDYDMRDLLLASGWGTAHSSDDED